MAEPAFYLCKACKHTWQRMQLKMGKNPPPVCPRCGSDDQCTDQAREDRYMREEYLGGTAQRKELFDKLLGPHAGKKIT